MKIHRKAVKKGAAEPFEEPPSGGEALDGARGLAADGQRPGVRDGRVGLERFSGLKPRPNLDFSPFKRSRTGVKRTENGFKSPQTRRFLAVSKPRGRILLQLDAEEVDALSIQARGDPDLGLEQLKGALVCHFND